MGQLQLSPVVAGIMRLPQWKFSPQNIASWILSCLDLGIDCFDSADIYGGYTAEGLFGQGVRLLSASQRQRLKIISKCGIQLVSDQRPLHTLKSYNTESSHIRKSVHQSLTDLGVDSLYALLIHRPDHLSEPKQIANTIQDLKNEGLIQHFGLSNYSAKSVELMHSLTSIATHQIEFSPLHLDPLYDDSLSTLMHHNITPMIWSPIAGGNSIDPNHPVTARWLPEFEKIAQNLNLTPLGLTISWLHRHPSRPVAVLGTRGLDRLKQALDGNDVKLDFEVWYQLLRLFTNSEVP